MHKIIITLLFSVIAFTAQADHENIYGLAPMGLPAQCGPSEIINQYIQDFGFEPETFSIAREGAIADNPPAYYVTTFTNGSEEHLIVLTAPSGSESCIVSHSFNLNYKNKLGT
tara:strand:+ start:5296 stop:5634 length:339 start_codon:yes stop_codon:yes gene_type:complete